jgi:hypothetical protein
MRTDIAAAAARRSTALASHGLHIVEGLLTLVVFLGSIWLAEYLQARKRKTANRGASDAKTNPRIPRDALLLVLVLAGVVAVGVHYAVMPEHFEESSLYGTFFLVAATAQLAYSGVVLLRPTRPLIVAGVAGNVALALLWLFTRTIEVPLGPSAGSKESIGILDVIATAAEILAAAAAVGILRRSARRHHSVRERGGATVPLQAR